MRNAKLGNQLKVTLKVIPTAHDSRVISARKLARARTQRKEFPSS